MKWTQEEDNSLDPLMNAAGEWVRSSREHRGIEHVAKSKPGWTSGMRKGGCAVANEQAALNGLAMMWSCLEAVWSSMETPMELSVEPVAQAC